MLSLESRANYEHQADLHSATLKDGTSVKTQTHTIGTTPPIQATWVWWLDRTTDHVIACEIDPPNGVDHYNDKMVALAQRANQAL